MPDANGVTVRLNRLERDVDEIRKKVDDFGAVRERATYLAREVEHLSDEVASLRKVLIGTAVSFAGSALIFAFSILAATGKIG